MSVSDGATTRRERILDMLQYIRGFMPGGLVLNQIQIYMSMAHGLTYKKSSEYVYEMQQGGVIHFNGGMVRINQANFKRLIEIMAPDRDPETGLRKLQPFENLDTLGLKNDPPKPKRKKDKETPGEPGGNPI